MSERFPWHIFHPRNLQSPARRFADISRFHAFRKPPVLPATSAPEAEFFYLSLVCQRDLLLTRLNLASLLRHTATLPKLILAHDESLTQNEVKTEFADWPAEIICYSRDDCSQHMAQENRHEMAEFCNRHIFGYKLAACLRASQYGRVLYSDADVLWLGDCNELMSEHQQVPILGSHDIGIAIDDNVVEMLPEVAAKLVQEKPRVCAGFAIYNQPLLSHPLVADTVQQIIANAEIGRLAEQTLVGALARTEGGIIPAEHVQMIQPNTAKLRLAYSQRPAFARHYPYNVRPQFWIDWKLA